MRVQDWIFRLDLLLKFKKINIPGTGKSLPEALILALTNPQYGNSSLNYEFSTRKLQVQNILCTQIVFWFGFDIQNYLCTQHVLSL